MTGDPAKRKPPLWRGIAILLGGFAGLCTIFAAVVTVVQGWQEHTQAGWPAAEARIEKCSVDLYRDSRQRDWYLINCRINYTAGIQDFATTLKSRQTPSPSRVISRDPWATWRAMQSWGDAHPAGTSIPVHYDPSNYKRALLMETDMPLGGPHTPDNFKVLGLFGTISVVLLGAARLGRRSTPGSNNNLSQPYLSDSK